MTDTPANVEPRVYGLLRPEIDPAVIVRVLDAIHARDGARAAAAIEPLHPADVADLIEQLNRRHRRILFELLSDSFFDPDRGAAVLSELEDTLRTEVIDNLEPAILAQLVRDLDSDDVTDILEDMPPAQRQRVLEALGGPARQRAERILAWPEDSAGRLMQHEVATAPADWTVGQMIDHMRAAKDLPPNFYHVVLTDEGQHPVGMVALGRMLGSPRALKLKDLTETDFRTFTADMPEKEVGYIFNQYHVITVPVVGREGRLLGVITVDDAMTVLDEEHEEDMLRLGGVGEESSLSDGPVATARRRLPWLAVATANSMVVALSISVFEATLEQVVALAILMPVVAAIGGAAGTQALTVAVRGLATRDLTGANRLRIIGREATTGMMNGAVLAVLLGVIAMAWFGDHELGLVVAMSMVVTIFIAGLTGIGVPIVLDKIGFDPALASGTFVTTAIDVLGFLTFLWLGTVMLL